MGDRTTAAHCRENPTIEQAVGEASQVASGEASLWLEVARVGAHIRAVWLLQRRHDNYIFTLPHRNRCQQNLVYHDVAPFSRKQMQKKQTGSGKTSREWLTIQTSDYIEHIDGDTTPESAHCHTETTMCKEQMLVRHCEVNQGI